MQQWQDVAAELPPDVAARLLPPESKKTRDEDALGQQLELVPGDLSTAEHAVWKLLSVDAGVHIDALAQASGLALPELMSALLALEMRELVRQLPGKCFVRKL